MLNGFGYLCFSLVFASTRIFQEFEVGKIFDIGGNMHSFVNISDVLLPVLIEKCNYYPASYLGTLKYSLLNCSVRPHKTT